MPTFRWEGIDLEGNSHYGRLQAASIDDLTQQLHEQHLGLVRARVSRHHSVQRRLSLTDKTLILRQLAILVGAGVFLPHALQVIAGRHKRRSGAALMQNLAQQVTSGVLLHVALAAYQPHFSPLVTSMIQVGEETGQLATALEKAADYLEAREQFSKKIRSLAILPLITLAVFLIIGSAIFILVVPTFASMLADVGRSLPWITQTLFRISAVVRSWAMLPMIGGLMIFAFLIRWWARTARAAHLLDTVFLHMPGVRRLVIASNFVAYLDALAALLDRGVPMRRALSVAQEAVTNRSMQSRMHAVAERVDEGHALSAAFEQVCPHLVDADLLTLMRVGEQSGCLARMLGRAAGVQRDLVDKITSRCALLFQPALMITLGLFIGGLIYAVYVPIIDLAHIVG